MIQAVRNKASLKSLKPGDFIYYEEEYNQIVGEYLGDGVAKVSSMTFFPDPEMAHRPKDVADLSFKKGNPFVVCETPKWWNK